MKVGVTSGPGGRQLVDALRDRGATVTWGPASGTDAHLDPPADPGPARELVHRAVDGRLDLIVFTAPPEVGNLMTIATHEGLHDRLTLAVRRGATAAVALGPATATELERVGMPVSVMPQQSQIDALLRALDTWWRCRGEVLPPRVQLDPDACAARVGVRVCLFGALEFRVLAALVRRPGVACSRELLAREAWCELGAAGHPPIKHHVSRIRSKLGPAGAAIQTVRSVGYRYWPARLPASSA